MGSTYANVTLRDVDLAAVRAAAPRPVFLLPAGSDVVVCAEADGWGELVIGGALSAALGCVALGASVVDDDLLAWQVHRDGRLLSEGAVPDPFEVFEEGEPGPPTDQLAAELATAVERTDLAPALADLFARDHVFASDLHARVVALLGLAPVAVGRGYRTLQIDGPMIDTATAEHLE